MRSYWPLISSLIFTPVAGADEACVACELRDALAVAATYTGEQWSQLSGGVATGSRYLDNLDITIDADAERLIGVEGLQLFAYLIYNNGHSLNELSGTAQGVSNIEATDAVRLYELWTQWNFGSGEQSLRFGLYDLNSEFDSIESAGLFINPSHGIGPDLAQTGHNGPSIFPATSLGARWSKSRGAWSAQVAALDAVPGHLDHPDRTAVQLSRDEGALLVGETNYRSSVGRIGVGYWRYSADFEELDASGHRDDNAGAYVMLEAPAFANESASMNMFVRAGVANGRINPVDRYFGMGAVYTIASQSREHQIGLAAAVAEFGEPYRRFEASAGNMTNARESILELTYRVNVSDWLSIQPDVQYIKHPNVDAQLESAWVVGLRFEVSAQRGWPR